MSSSAPSSPFTGLSTTRQQDAVRVLVLLREAGDRPPPDPPRPDATACIQAESRLHALDFWLRNPDYLAFELLELNEQTPDVALVEQACRLINDEERHFPMLRLQSIQFRLERAISVQDPTLQVVVELSDDPVVGPDQSRRLKSA